MTRFYHRRSARIGLALGGVLVVAAFAAWRLAGRDDRDDGQRAMAPVVTVDGSGQPVVVLDSAAAARAGITAVALPASSYRSTLSAYGSVVDVQALATARTRVATAEAAATRAQAGASAARQELERMRTLYADDRNASQKALQHAQAAYQGGEADAAAATAAARAQAAAVLQQWGPVVGRWAVDGSAALDRLLERKDVLILLALPAGTPLSSPPARALVRAGGPPAQARYLSPASRTDPRVQGTGLFYVARGGATLLPGMNVDASLSVGAPVPATLVPRSAVLWADDGAWIYVQTAPDSYVRRPIATDSPTPDGYAVTGLPAGTRAVVHGAQLLLSQESRPQIPTGDEGDDDG